MQNAFFIVGPTAVGKTGLAVELAERFGADIINADAYQIYRGFPLLTAKPSPDHQRRVVHHLLGHVDPAETYNVARFLDDATRAIKSVSRGGRPVIVVGGNGLYIKVLTHGLATLPPPQPELRVELEAMPQPELLNRLRVLDPVAHARIDHQNARRVVRAVEVCLLTGQTFSSFQTEWSESPAPLLARGIFLMRDRTDLVARINQRVDEMFARGVVEEVRHIANLTLSPTAAQILGLPDIQAYLAGQINLLDCQEKIKIATRQYAKRQVTWFKRETCFLSVKLSAKDDGSKGLDGSVCEHFENWINATRSRTAV